jgi:hypothetical protein
MSRIPKNFTVSFKLADDGFTANTAAGSSLFFFFSTTTATLLVVGLSQCFYLVCGAPDFHSNTRTRTIQVHGSPGKKMRALLHLQTQVVQRMTR